MIAAVINAVFVAVGSALGLLLKNRISEKYSKAIMNGIALCVALIGVNSALKSNNTLCVIICMVVGIMLGELLRIEDRLDSLGDRLKSRFIKSEGDSRFTEGFMTAVLLFCVGSMTVVGSMEAGINHDYTMIVAKSVLDGISSISFAAAMGVGVLFSSLGVLLYQGALTLLFILVGPVLPDAVVAEMTGVGGLLIIGLSINVLGLLGDKKLCVGNMLPAMFLPVIYIPVYNWITGLLG